MPQVVVCTEGPDRCGKTEIAAELSRRILVPTFKNPREAMFFEEDPGYFTKAMKYGDPYFASYLKQTGASVILDRSYPSEFVYSQVFERATDWGMLRIVDEMYADVGLKIVLCHRSDYSNASVDQFKAITKERLQQLDGLYKEFCAWTKCEVLDLVVDDEDLESQMARVVPFIKGVDYANAKRELRKMDVAIQQRRFGGQALPSYSRSFESSV